MRTQSANGQFDEIRVISLPPNQTAAVNRLLREEDGWRILDARVTQDLGPDRADTLVVYVLGHAEIADQT